MTENSPKLTAYDIWKALAEVAEERYGEIREIPLGLLIMMLEDYFAWRV